MLLFASSYNEEQELKVYKILGENRNYIIKQNVLKNFFIFFCGTLFSVSLAPLFTNRLLQTIVKNQLTIFERNLTYNDIPQSMLMEVAFGFQQLTHYDFLQAMRIKIPFVQIMVIILFLYVISFIINYLILNSKLKNIGNIS